MQTTPRIFVPAIVAVLAPVLFLEATMSGLAAESLDRGVVALPAGEGKVHISWRLLATDPPDITFDVLRHASEKGDPAPVKLNAGPITDSCNYVDATAGGQRRFYSVQPLVAGRKGAAAAAVQPPAQAGGFIRLKLQGGYRPQKVGLADFDGDGRLDYLVKQPDFNTDPYQKEGYWKRSEDTYKLEAYRHDGPFMWRYDMGWAIEEGIWYSPIVVYDLDGDGKAEVMCKGGEGDPREPTGHVRQGPEYLVVLDGQTGQVKKKLPWPSREGFDDYNYYSRNLLGIAYLDGRQPHLIVERGTYKIIKVEACDPALTLKWRWEASGEYEKYRGQGMVGDIIAEEPGMECYAGEAKGGSNYWLYAASGKRLSDQSLGELAPKAIYWLDGPTKVFIVGNTG